MSAERDDPSNDDDPARLVCLVEASTAFEAQTIIAVLADSDIRAFSFAAGPLGFAGSMSGIDARMPVQVAAADLDRARAALKEARLIGASIDWDSVDVGEPEPDRGVLRSLLDALRSPLFAARMRTLLIAVLVLLVCVIVMMAKR